MAATYGPDPRAPLGFRIPFNAESGEVIEERWRNWRRHDPINLVAKYRANLKSLRGITIDCGWRDRYSIADIAAVPFVKRIEEEIAPEEVTADQHPRVTGWWTKIQARPAFARARIGPFLDL